MDRGGLSGDDGPTHHGLFDISYLRSVPNLVHMVPANEDELADMMQTALEFAGPSAIRYPRGVGPGVAVKAVPVAMEIGKAEVLREGSDVAIFGLGALLPLAVQMAARLEAEGLSVAVVNPRFVKPMDAAVVERLGRTCGLIVTFEDHVLAGGFGSAVMETLNAAGLRRRWCGWAGRMSSSSMGGWMRCGRNTGFLWSGRWSWRGRLWRRWFDLDRVALVGRAGAWLCGNTRQG